MHLLPPRAILSAVKESDLRTFIQQFSQVWFQNKRSKERRLKQLTSMGRSPFFGGARKMRGFPLNLSHAGIGTDDGHSTGFSYFSDKFDFSYATPVSFHHDFFGAQPPANTHEPTFGCSNDAGEWKDPPKALVISWIVCDRKNEDGQRDIRQGKVIWSGSGTWENVGYQWKISAMMIENWSLLFHTLKIDATTSQF
ncbi:hypothetical protein QAD02_013643 [Eretmocerus hayati]|uniref:Uncharacterized protein n=1 Tax=Eretmocerus hayati TaxID=131215 RepID=A0ACC2P341_9HYME|nr:hypothetical protein QAD02_013643 [Eretmocerus hayati]